MAHLAAANNLNHAPPQFWLNAALRVAAWISPISLLSVIELSPRKDSRMSTVCHALADPIDLAWCLIHKLSTWTEYYNWAAEFVQRECPTNDRRRRTRVIATVFAGLDEIMGPGRNPRLSILRAAAQLGANDPKRFTVWHRTALELVDYRKHEVHFVLLVTALYVLQLFAVMIPGFALVSVPSLGTSAAALLVSWLVPIALLNGRMGTFRSRRAFLDVMNRFADAENALAKDGTANNDITFRLRWAERVAYLDSLRQDPGIDIYRPWKARCVNRPHGESAIPPTAVMAVVPVVLSATASLILSWVAVPDRLVYQQSLPLALFAAWILSAFLSGIIYFHISREYQWRVMLAKDVLVGVPIVFVIILSISGLTDKYDCQVMGGRPCGGDYFQVDGDLQHQGNESRKITYASVLVSCLAFQLFFYAAVLRKCWMGLMVMQWSEEIRKEEFSLLEENEGDNTTRLFRAWIRGLISAPSG